VDSASTDLEKKVPAAELTRLGSFVERQFSPATTFHQKIFDIVFGVAIPVTWIILWYVDLFATNAGTWGYPQSDDVLFILYFSALGIFTILNLTIRIAFRRFTFFLSGFFLAMILLLIPCMVILIPFFLMLHIFEKEYFFILSAPITAFVFIRNTVSVFRSRNRVRKRFEFLLPISGFVLFFALPFVPVFTICHLTDSNIDKFLALEEKEFESCLDEFGGTKWWFLSDRITDRYFDIACNKENFRTSEIKECCLLRLRTAYSRITGREMDCSYYYEMNNPWGLRSCSW